MKLEVNFEYEGKVIPIMVDESLVHLNNMLELAYDLEENLEEYSPKKADSLMGDARWDKSYDYLIDNLHRIFSDFIGEEGMYLVDFVKPKEEDKTLLRVIVENV